MNYKFLAKNGLTISFVVALLAVIITLVPVFGGIEALDGLADDPNIRSTSPESSIFYTGIYVTFVLAAVAFGLAILLSLFGVFTNLKAAKTGLIMFAVMAVLFFVLNSTASTDLTPEMSEILNNPDYEVNGDMGIYKWVSAGISGTLILTGLAFASMILMEIWNFFKNS